MGLGSGRRLLSRSVHIPWPPPGTRHARAVDHLRIPAIAGRHTGSVRSVVRRRTRLFANHDFVVQTEVDATGGRDWRSGDGAGLLVHFVRTAVSSDSVEFR